MMTPFVVGRESSVRALEEALAADKKIFLATQHDASVDEPKPNEIFQVGTIVNIVQSLKLPDGNIKVLVEGLERGKILQVTDNEGYFEATIRTAKYPTEITPQMEAAMQRVTTLFEQYVKLCQSLNYETMIAAVKMDDPAKLTDTIAANLQLSIEEKQELLEIFDPADRLTWAVGDAAQCDLWFPPRKIPLEDGTIKVLPVLVITAAHSRFITGRMIPTRKTEDLLLGSWELIEQLGRVPRRLIWDNEGGIGRGQRRAEGVTAFIAARRSGSRLRSMPRTFGWTLSSSDIGA
jgi:Lon protease-like protein